MIRKDRDELLRISKWSEAVVQYMKRWPENSIISDHYDKIIPKLLESGDLEGMKSVFLDLRSYAAELAPDMQIELNEIVLEKSGYGLFEEFQRLEDEILSIIRRGVIANEKEYRLLIQRANDTTKINEETEAINRLLLAYDKSITNS